MINNKKKYIHRSIEKEILKSSKEFPVIGVTGPRQTGKSTLLQKLFPQHHYVTLDHPFNQKLAIDDPETFLENHKAPIIIDEIQYAPELLKYIKIRVDQARHKNGAYCLTGSQVFPLMQGLSESLAGRIAIYELLGFSFKELHPDSSLPVNQCFQMIHQGFFPEICVHHVNSKTFFNSYIQTYLERDIRQIKAVQDLMQFQTFLELIAARCGSLLNLNEIAKECAVSAPTIRHWLTILEISRLILLLRPFSKNITKRVIKSPKIFFSDTGLLAHILRYPSADTLSHGPLAGAFFENFVITEVFKTKFNYNAQFECYFYRDSTHNEIDLILDHGYKKQFFEIKNTSTLKTEHYKTLKKTATELGVEEAFLISHNPQEITLEKNIKHLPWWKVQDHILRNI